MSALRNGDDLVIQDHFSFAFLAFDDGPVFLALGVGLIRDLLARVDVEDFRFQFDNTP